MLSVARCRRAMPSSCSSRCTPKTEVRADHHFGYNEHRRSSAHEPGGAPAASLTLDIIPCEYQTFHDRRKSFFQSLLSVVRESEADARGRIH